MRILTHVCCGPCFTAVHENLAKEHEVAAFYDNPNIHPGLEWRRRLLYLRRFCDQRQAQLTVAPYNPRIYFSAVNGQEKQPDRCRRCYELRLESTARTAAGAKYEAFTTTLLISPFQDHETLRDIGRAMEKRFDIEFLYRDFRPLFERGREFSQAEGMYRQRYCGCLYSETERFRAKLAKSQDRLE